MKKDWNIPYKNGFIFTPVNEIVLDSIFDTLKHDGIKTCLDIGCGRGELIKQLELRGLKCTGIDLAEAAKPDIVGDFMELDVPNYDIIFTNKVIAFNHIRKFVERVASKTNTFVCISPVIVPEYKDKYNQHLLSISAEYDVLVQALHKHFSEVLIVDTRYFDDYGCELTLVATK